MILKPNPWKPTDLDLAPGYAALSELPRRRRRGGTLAIWLVAAGTALASAGGLAVVLAR
jgi:hypothetical protein